MSEFLRAALIIDLEENEGWKNNALPLHVPVVPQFTMKTENLPAASRQLSERLEQFESFVSTTNMMPGSEVIIRQLSSRAMMRLHLDALVAVREFTEPMELHHVGDWYEPRVVLREQNQVFHKPTVAIETVTFAIAPVEEGQLPVWEPAYAFELGSKG
jgi:hypothetical protein